MENLWSICKWNVRILYKKGVLLDMPAHFDAAPEPHLPQPCRDQTHKMIHPYKIKPEILTYE